MTELGEFVKHQDEFKALGVQILGISVDPPEKGREVAAKVKTPFPILSDEKGLVMDLYGTRNPEWDGFLNVPTLVLIDRGGIIRWIHQAEDYRVRGPVGSVLDQARKLHQKN
ncbi:MAG: peroxiredoxin family protein [Acidobacteria bacterium]|nr:peroxiredoxin family protein [Acidobacteriota bacterium]